MDTESPLDPLPAETVEATLSSSIREAVAETVGHEARR